jgi:hypothetical protein
MSDTLASGDRLSQRSADFGLASEPSETGPDPLIGVDLDGVRIERFLGQGGMGRVYVARQTHPARTVAVKVMLAPLLGTAMVQRFRREADALARLRHPGIAQIFMAGCHRGGVVEVPYYVMELIPGAATLVQACERRSLPIRERLELLLAVCEAAAVADDLRRLLGGEPLAASRMQDLFPHGLKWVVSWCRHRPASVAASAVLIVAGLAAVVVGMAGSARSPRDVQPATAGLSAGVETSSSDGPTAPASRGVAGSAAVQSRSPPFREIRLSPLEDDWDRYVVSIEAAERFTEQYAGGTTFIRPTEAGREAAVTMRFDMPFPIHNATLTAPLAVWTTGDPFPYDPGARAALDVSPNGEAWTTVAELKAGAGGVNAAVHDIGRSWPVARKSGCGRG